MDDNLFAQVLFVKNLANKVTEVDLISLFGRFQKDNHGSQIVYRLLTGRMKGQAFVTFPGKMIIVMRTTLFL
jgi:RNA recognition motif-containing protein